MESSDEEDDFSSHEWITPQSKINSLYQSHTEKVLSLLLVWMKIKGIYEFSLPFLYNKAKERTKRKLIAEWFTQLSYVKL